MKPHQAMAPVVFIGCLLATVAILAALNALFPVGPQLKSGRQLVDEWLDDEREYRRKIELTNAGLRACLEELRQSNAASRDAVDKMAEALAQLGANPPAPLTQEEITEEIKAYRESAREH